MTKTKVFHDFSPNKQNVKLTCDFWDKDDTTKDHTCPPDLKENIENLATIVLIHEFVHWIILFKINYNWHLQKTEAYEDSKHYLYFHEGFAQLLTLFIIEKKGRKDLEYLFYWLAKEQSEEYRKYKELKKVFGTIEAAVSFLEILNELDKPIDFWEACVGPYKGLYAGICGNVNGMNLLSRLQKSNKNIHSSLKDETKEDPTIIEDATILGDYGF